MQITVTIERVLYPRGGGKSESGFYVAETEQNGAKLICKGTMAWAPAPMETLTLSGDYIVYKGERQFKFTGAKLTLPLESRSQLAYVCERANGIGPKLQEMIWTARGESWRELRRGEIKGLSDEAHNNFTEQIKAFEANKEKAEIISWLENKGATLAMATAAFEAWGPDAPGVVNSDCYRLASLPGFSFKSVDERVRRNLGIEDNDPRRMKAAVIYAMEQITADGSTAVKWFIHFDKIRKLLPEVAPELIEDTASEMVKDGVIKIFPAQAMGALSKDYQNERAIWEYSTKPMDTEPEIYFDITELLSAGESFLPDAAQIAAVEFALKNRLVIINGGAGTGKTTIIRLICAGLKRYFPQESFNLCAFAGKAAARLREATGVLATTIHVLLGYNGKIFMAGPLTGQTIIIDEASMVNSELMAEIVKRGPARLILVGDQAQLPPVGAGQPFHDLIQILPESVRTLQTCYRNTEAVFQAAAAIRAGNCPPLKLKSKNEEWTVSACVKPEIAQEKITAWAEQDWLDFERDIVLCPKNGEKDGNDEFQPATVNGLNAALLAIDRKKRGADLFGSGAGSGGKFIAGDRVINGKNFPDEQVWNGTTGTVQAVSHDGEVYIKLDVPVVDIERTTDPKNPVYKDEVKFTADMAKSLQYAYALTIHKSQGSQYRRVVMVCLSRDKFVLDRSLVYTGVTRTREECVVCGDYYAFKGSIETVKSKDTVLQLLAIN
jgi:exodeoxyribonuclease V alpha subunit